MCSCCVLHSNSSLWGLNKTPDFHSYLSYLFILRKIILTHSPGAQVGPQTLHSTFIFFCAAFDVSSYILSEFCHALTYRDALLACLVSTISFSLDIPPLFLNKCPLSLYGNMCLFLLLHLPVSNILSYPIFMIYMTITFPKYLFFPSESISFKDVNFPVWFQPKYNTLCTVTFFSLLLTYIHPQQPLIRTRVIIQGTKDLGAFSSVMGLQVQIWFGLAESFPYSDLVYFVGYSALNI